jgi:hypothetical protein
LAFLLLNETKIGGTGGRRTDLHCWPNRLSAIRSTSWPSRITNRPPLIFRHCQWRPCRSIPLCYGTIRICVRSTLTHSIRNLRPPTRRSTPRFEFCTNRICAPPIASSAHYIRQSFYRCRLPLARASLVCPRTLLRRRHCRQQCRRIRAPQMHQQRGRPQKHGRPQTIRWHGGRHFVRSTLHRPQVRANRWTQCRSRSPHSRHRLCRPHCAASPNANRHVPSTIVWFPCCFRGQVFNIFIA